MIETGSDHARSPIIEMRGIVKEYPGVRALKGVDLTIFRNEIVGLVGENGAGKSTLMKILIGLLGIDGGSMTVRGVAKRFQDPQEAIRSGIGMVFQEQSLIPNLTVSENITLCHDRKYRHGPFLGNKAIVRDCSELLERCGFKVSPRSLVSDLTQAQRQLVEIGRLLWLSGLYGIEDPVLILDEPTTVLVKSEIDQLFGLLKGLENKASIIFISHRLEEVLELTDRIVVFKDGRNIKDFPTANSTVEIIEGLMVGHELASDHYIVDEQTEPVSEEVLRVEGMGLQGKFAPIDLAVRRGEILCLAGVLGSGKEDICRCLAGVERASQGKIFVNGKLAVISDPRAAIAAGIGYLPSDRRDEGLGLQMDVKANITLVMLRELLVFGVLSHAKERNISRDWVEKLRIKVPSLKAFVSTLSGGNQQKVVMAKWLASNARVILLDHPTRGVDVGAKEEIYRHIRALARQGMAMIVMCDTIEEDIGLCNRMIALRDGRKTAEVPCQPGKKPTPIDIIRHVV